MEATVGMGAVAAMEAGTAAGVTEGAVILEVVVLAVLVLVVAGLGLAAVDRVLRLAERLWVAYQVRQLGRRRR